MCVLDGRASLCGKTLQRGQDISGGAKLDLGFGTLGGLVRCKTDGHVYLVTAAHVLLCVDNARAPRVVPLLTRERGCITDSLPSLQWRHLMAMGHTSNAVERMWMSCHGSWDAWQTKFNRYWEPHSQPAPNPILRRLMNEDKRL